MRSWEGTQTREVTMETEPKGGIRAAEVTWETGQAGSEHQDDLAFNLCYRKQKGNSGSSAPFATYTDK